MDDDFDYDYDGMDGGQMDDEDPLAIELENMFYEAEDKIRDDPHGSLNLFDQIIDKEENLNPEDRKQSFQSLKNSILIRSRPPVQLDIIKHHLSKLLGLVKYQYRNDGNEALNLILEALMKIDDQSISQILRQFIESLKELQLSQLFINANFKLCKIYTEIQDHENLKISINNIYQAIDQVQDQDRKNNILLELYAYEINWSNMTAQYDYLKEVYGKITSLNANIHDPRINAIIKETVGKMQLKEKKWDEARKSLMDSFYSYQDIGDQKAKQVLRYAVLASILGNYSINLFDDLRARIYESDEGIQSMKQIRLAYDQKDIDLFTTVKNQLANDLFLNEFLGDLHKVISFNKIKQQLNCYQRIRLDYIARQLKTDELTAQKYFYELILSNQIQAEVDQINGLIIKTQIEDQSIKGLRELVDKL